jgi:arabinogalactan oligomer/maltooligosaccharide transport system substrate-binding protein
MIMKLKRALAFTLSVLMAGSMAGCGKTLPQNTKTASAAGTTAASSAVGEMKPESGAKLMFRTSSASQLNFAKAVAKKFEAKYGVPVTAEDGSVYDQNKTNLETVSGKGPDVFMSPHDKTIENQRAGLLLKLDSRITAKLKQDVSDIAMKTVTVDGGVYGVPVSVETYVMFYNKKLVKGAPASSFEQLLKESKSFNNAAQNKFWFLSNVSEGATIYPMLSTYGYKPFGKDGTDNDKPSFDTPEFGKGLEVLKKYHDLIPAASGDLANWDFLNNQFVTGKTAYLISGQWNVKTFRDSKADFGVAPLPTYDGKKETSFAFVQNAQVSAYSKYPHAAQLFAQYLVSDEGAQLLYADASCVTSRKDISTVKGLAQDKQLSAIVKCFNESTPMPTAKRISYFWTICANVGPAVFDGQMTPKAAVTKAKSDWDSFLKAE